MDERVDAAQRGDREAIEALLGEQFPALVRWLESRVGQDIRSRESISDLAQSVCREVLVDVERIEVRSEAEFRAWMFQQAGRKVIDRYRFYKMAKRSIERERPLTEGVQPCHEATPSQHLGWREELEAVRRSLGELPEPQREAVTLSRIVGLDYPQIAQRMGRSESAVRGLVARGLAAISREL